MAFEESGIYAPHRDRIADVCETQDVFLFIRPTTQDSMRLIGHGYPTKSTDVHSKSSDWGPMAGFVPCDPAFDKKSGGGAKPNPKLVVAADADHPEVRHMQLSLTNDLAANLFGEYAKIIPLDKKEFRPTEKGEIFRKAGVSTSTRMGSSAGQAASSNVRFCKATSAAGNAATAEFALTPNNQGAGWLVWWLHYPFTDRLEFKLVPLEVFAYQVDGVTQPVTGDYDLWLVAPFAKRANRNHVAATSNPSPHGPSAATPYITQIIEALNVACRRDRGGPVFRHGAEAQNYGFTQGIDEKIAVITPGRGKHIILRHQLPQALSEVRARGYLVYTNKRYTENDPMIMHKAGNAAQLEKLRQLRLQIGAFVAAKRDYQEARAGSAPSSALKPALGKMLLTAAKLHSASQKMGLHDGVTPGLGNNELYLIKKFQAEFNEWVRWSIPALVLFNPADFGRDASHRFDLAHRQRIELQGDLETYVRNSTTGTGATDQASVARAMELFDQLAV
jgi:Anthrax toxin LF subunit